MPGGAVHKLPADLHAALVGDSTALEACRDITPLARNEFVCWVDDAKQEATREKRIRRTVEPAWTDSADVADRTCRCPDDQETAPAAVGVICSPPSLQLSRIRVQARRLALKQTASNLLCDVATCPRICTAS